MNANWTQPLNRPFSNEVENAPARANTGTYAWQSDWRIGAVLFGLNLIVIIAFAHLL